MILSWKTRRNLENSLQEFLSTNASGLTVFYKGEELPIDVRVGFAPREDWKLPVISIYNDSRIAQRVFIGQNTRLKTHLVIIDIRALDDGMRQDLAEWVADTINDGFNYYDYTPNPANPSSPNKDLTGKVAVEFLTDNKINADVNADEFDKFRHNISINAFIACKENA